MKRSGDDRNSWFEREYVGRVEWNAISRECRHENDVYLGTYVVPRYLGQVGTYKISTEVTQRCMFEALYY